jgi:hypothetical protein
LRRGRDPEARRGAVDDSMDRSVMARCIASCEAIRRLSVARREVEVGSEVYSGRPRKKRGQTKAPDQKDE